MKCSVAACRRLSGRIGYGLCAALLSGILGYAAVLQAPIAVIAPTPPSSVTETDEPTENPTVSAASTDPSITAEAYPFALSLYDLLFTSEEVSIPSGELKIVSTDLSKNPASGTVFLKNNTDYSLSVSDFLSADSSLPTTVLPSDESDEPLVLIYHTHGTEAYAEEGRVSYKESELPRSDDTENNVVAVGKVLADTLNANGIPTIHCEIMHDANGEYYNSYSNSARTVKEYLEAYPSIRYIFDVHRDALTSDTVAYKTLTYDGSTPVAQIMLVVGTDNAGANHPDWRENLSFAVNTQYYLTQRLNHLVRPISVKRSSFNQQYADIAMLIEVGTCVNTLAEAKASAVILGETLAGMIRSETAGSTEVT